MGRLSFKSKNDDSYGAYLLINVRLQIRMIWVPAFGASESNYENGTWVLVNIPQNSQNAASQKTPCTFNFNLTNRSRVRLTKKDLEAIEKQLNGIFATGGYRATLNNPSAATNPAFNYNLTIYNNFPNSYPQDARLDPYTIGYTRLTRQIPDSPYPDIYFPGPTGGVSVNHIGASYGTKYTRGPALRSLVAGVGAHEMIAHYLLAEPGHPEEYAAGITGEAIGDPAKANLVISSAVKEQLDKICNSGQLPK